MPPWCRSRIWWNEQIRIMRLERSWPRRSFQCIHPRWFSPSCFKVGITTMIPKKAGAVEPSDFRPITLSPIISPISRLFHRILARRLSVSLDQDPRQKAFIRHRDGLGENVYILKQAIQISKNKCTALKIAFLDASKAFDSVSHLALLFAVERCGAPSEVTRYIKALYEDNITYIRSKGKFSDPIEVCRGMKQGDPLSPILFNCVVKYITGGLDAAYGIDLGGLKVNHLSFADDLVLLATSDEGLQCLVDAAVARIKTCGLNINSSKCSTLNIVTNAKKKQGHAILQPSVSQTILHCLLLL